MLLHHPEEAECAGHNSGVHIGEQLLTKDFFSAFSWIGFRVAGNKWASLHVCYIKKWLTGFDTKDLHTNNNIFY